ncbi:MAG: hypothetical protein MH321_02255 [Leptospiraceae bacterium]|nr:hypothetical protein [Leptospiraceae bacterium]
MKKVQNVRSKQTSLRRMLTTVACSLVFTFCNNPNQVDQSKSDQNLLVGLLAGQAQEANKDFVLNGQWNEFTGNGTSSTTILTVAGKSGSKGVLLSDSSGFGGFSSCSILEKFENNSGFYITSNPINNGACFAGDTNKGKFFKVVFFKNLEKVNSYWYCNLNATTSKSSIEDAVAVVDNSVRTNPGSSGCGSFSWSRIEKR